jgi:hypothetical protein
VFYEAKQRKKKGKSLLCVGRTQVYHFLVILSCDNVKRDHVADADKNCFKDGRKMGRGARAVGDKKKGKKKEKKEGNQTGLGACVLLWVGKESGSKAKKKGRQLNVRWCNFALPLDL